MSNLPLTAVLLCLTNGLLLASHLQDELISARCQAKCLSDFEQAAIKLNKSRKLLKHSIIPMCKSDGNCSSCAKPCREPFETLETCIDNVCKDTTSPDSCEQSCHFMTEIQSNKPGSCPKARIDSLNSYALECVGSCSKDGDCQEDEKCCQTGCSKYCVKADNLLKGLLPIPTEVTVTERKRGRSAIVRWVMSLMKPEQTNTFANIYLVQWRWGVKPDDNHMTKWQTISIRNKEYAILKHLLSPGRYYKIRVAAVNVNGSRGFSKESDPFRLHKSPKAPGKPQTVEIGSAKLVDGLVIQELQWSPPLSDLPIYHYQVSWSENHLRLAYNEMASDQPHPQVTDSDYDRPDESFPGISTKLVPGSELSTSIAGLKPDTEYIVEVQAVVESDTEQLLGDKALLIVNTSDSLKKVSMSKSAMKPQLVYDGSAITFGASSAFKSASESRNSYTPAIYNVNSEKPYYQNGLLKSILTWELRDDATKAGEKPNFSLSWWPRVCMGSSYPEFALTKPLNSITEDSFFELYDLQFSCVYVVTIRLNNPELVAGEAEFSFETPLCQDTEIRGEIVPNCPTLAPEVPSKPSDFHCEIHLKPPTDLGSAYRPTVKKNITAQCNWQPPTVSDRPIIGYRLIYGRKSPADDSVVLDKKPAEILPASMNFLLLHSLLPDTDYLVRLQAMSDVGVGPSVHVSLSTPNLSPLSVTSAEPPDIVAVVTQVAIVKQLKSSERREKISMRHSTSSTSSQHLSRYSVSLCAGAAATVLLSAMLSTR